MPIGDILVSDSRSDIEHDDCTLALDAALSGRTSIRHADRRTFLGPGVRRFFVGVDFLGCGG
jgi:hypothetical protein